MADPLSIFGAVITVLDLCTEATKQLRKIREEYNLASRTLNSISSECFVLSKALEQVRSLAAQPMGPAQSLYRPGTELGSALETALVGCETTLSALCLQLRKFTGEEDKATTSMGMSKKLMFAFSVGGLKESLLQIRGQQTALQLLISTFQMTSLAEIHRVLEVNSGLLRRVADDTATVRSRYGHRLKTAASSLSLKPTLGREAGMTHQTSMPTAPDDTVFSFDEQIVKTKAYRKAFAADVRVRTTSLPSHRPHHLETPPIETLPVRPPVQPPVQPLTQEMPRGSPQLYSLPLPTQPAFPREGLAAPKVPSPPQCDLLEVQSQNHRTRPVSWTYRAPNISENTHADGRPTANRQTHAKVVTRARSKSSPSNNPYRGAPPVVFVQPIQYDFHHDRPVQIHTRGSSVPITMTEPEHPPVQPSEFQHKQPRRTMDNFLNAISQGDRETIIQLVVSGLKLNVICPQSQMTPVTQAVKDKPEILPLLFELGAIPDMRDGFGLTPLKWAVTCGQVEAVRFLKESGVDVGQDDGMGTTPLTESASKDHSDIVRYLVVEAKVNINQRDAQGMTALNRAVTSGSVSCLQLLLGLGAVYA